MMNQTDNQPLIAAMRNREAVLWLNPGCDNVLSGEVTLADVEDAAARLNRFAPYIAAAFPETAASGGII